jgi:hypothetical protein
MPAPHRMPTHRSTPSPADAAGSLAAGWELLHEAGEAVSGLAQLGREPLALVPRDFALRAAAAGPARLALAEQAIDDCAAALHTGLTVLIAAGEAGRDCTAAALTLWREFDRARSGLLALTAPN